MIGDEGWQQHMERSINLGALMFTCDQLGIDKARVRQAYDRGSIFDAYEMAGYLWAEKLHQGVAQALRDQEGIE